METILHPDSAQFFISPPKLKGKTGRWTHHYQTYEAGRKQNINREEQISCISIECVVCLGGCRKFGIFVLNCFQVKKNKHWCCLKLEMFIIFNILNVFNISLNCSITLC